MISSPQAMMPEWQPIETAPKDGADVLIGLHGRSVHEARWLEVNDDYAIRNRQKVWERGWYWAGYSGAIGPIFPTHWMPLPPPPVPTPMKEEAL